MKLRRGLHEARRSWRRGRLGHSNLTPVGAAATHHRDDSHRQNQRPHFLIHTCAVASEVLSSRRLPQARTIRGRSRNAQTRATFSARSVPAGLGQSPRGGAGVGQPTGQLTAPSAIFTTRFNCCSFVLRAHPPLRSASVPHREAERSGVAAPSDVPQQDASVGHNVATLLPFVYMTPAPSESRSIR
jgi:hypothetical protein